MLFVSCGWADSLMSNVPDVIPGVHLSTVLYRKLIYSRSASIESLIHLMVHTRCTGPLELGPKLPSSNSFSLVPS